MLNLFIILGRTGSSWLYWFCLLHEHRTSFHLFMLLSLSGTCAFHLLYGSFTFSVMIPGYLILNFFCFLFLICIKRLWAFVCWYLNLLLCSTHLLFAVTAWRRQDFLCQCDFFFSLTSGWRSVRNLLIHNCNQTCLVPL